MLAAQTKLQNAQKVKQFLIKKDLLNHEYNLVKEFSFIYFPLIKKARIPHAKTLDTLFKFPKKPAVPSLKEILKKKLTRKQLELLPRSQEIVGKIMVLEMPEQLKKHEKLIAQAYLKVNQNIETVVKKDHIHEGEYRLRKVRILAGKKTKETIHHENNIQLKLDLEKTYFSARTAHERLRIARQVKKNENILVMFSGAAPLPLVIAKNSPARHLIGIELNPLAHQFALENLKLNKLEHKITIYLGDVRTILPKMKQKFDRIALPLPKIGRQFLPLALKKSKPGTLIHLYSFLPEKEIKNEAKNIKESTKNQVKVLRAVKCGQFSPYVYRVCFDLKVITHLKK